MFLPSNLTDTLTNLSGNLVLVLGQQDKARRLAYPDLLNPTNTALLSELTTSEYIEEQLDLYWQVPLSELTSAVSLKASTIHAHTKASLGLGLVENLSPANLPISTAQQTALDTKLDIGEVELPEWPIDTPEW